MALPPIMVYGEDVTHVLTEEGIANLLLCRTPEEREQAIRGVAGYTAVGMARDKAMVENLRDRGVIRAAMSAALAVGLLTIGRVLAAGTFFQVLATVVWAVLAARRPPRQRAKSGYGKHQQAPKHNRQGNQLGYQNAVWQSKQPNPANK